ncbi:MAG: amidohydrolase family protein [Oscillospiraceae bacterium]|nr:amidohydrolase family protein [Oscillospiraceae bacterium]
MIIDADTHISPTLEWGTSITAEQLIAKMDKIGVDKCLTWIHNPYIRSKLDHSVAYIYESMKKYPDRILGFGWVDPQLGMDHALALTDKCLNAYHLYGIKLNGAVNKFPIDSKEIAYPILEKIAKAGKIAAFHSGCDDVANTHPYKIGKIARDFPEMPVLMIHMGGEAYADASSCAIEMAQEYKNITLIGSQVPKMSVLKAIRVLGAHRVAFGSDTPFALMGAELGGYKAMMEEEGMSGKDQDLVLGGSIAALFDL